MVCEEQALLTDRQTDRQTERNYGIDLLRLVAMFMVVILHVLGQGGVLSATTGCKNHVAWFIETTAYCAVDCYAIISGFVSYREIEKPYRYSKFLGFWLQVVTYSFGITLLAFLLRPESIGLKTVIKSFLPVATEQYWYVSAYAGLFFIIPWLNKLVRSYDRESSTSLIAVLAAVFVGYVTFANYFGDCFKLEQGYSFVWLSVLYLLGAWMKKCDIPSKLKSSHLLLVSAIFITLSWAAHDFFIGIFVNYTSFTIVFAAFALVAVFSKLKIGKAFSKLIACFAPAAFGVYLIHVQPVIWGHFMSSAFVWIAGYSAWMIPALVLGAAFCIFTVCLLIEKTRLLLFKLLRINQFISFAENKLDCIANACVEKITTKI